jgi:carbon-monoxide dehydrogenase medium subunit
MEVAQFSYHRPTTLVEACELGRTLGDKARYLAGGTELLVDFRKERDAAEHLIALHRVPDLKGIREDAESLRIGALSTLAEVSESPLVRRAFPALCEAVLTMAGVQIRNQGTIGGNFCRAVPCADTPPICIAGEARLRLVTTGGERSLPAEEFFIGPRETLLQPGELLAEILIPAQPAASGASYQRFSLRRGSALAVASVAARVTLKNKKISDARVVLGAVAPVPLPATECAKGLVGRAPSSDLFARAARSAAAEARPITDLRGSEAYRRDLIQVLAARAFAEATARARGARA